MKTQVQLNSRVSAATRKKVRVESATTEFNQDEIVEAALMHHFTHFDKEKREWIYREFKGE